MYQEQAEYYDKIHQKVDSVGQIKKSKKWPLNLLVKPREENKGQKTTKRAVGGRRG